MQFNQIITSSLIDYEGKNAIVTFAKGCNFACPGCYAKQVMESNRNYDWLDYLGDWNDGVVFLGGEPTIHTGLEDECRKAKKNNLAVKLDTNGYNPEVLERLLGEKLLDYVALDIKASPALYDKVVGKRIDLSRIERSISSLSKSGITYEFRTTVFPILDNVIRWMKKEEAEEMVKWASQYSRGKWFVQGFVAMGRGEMLDERLSSELLDKRFHETPRDKLEEIREVIEKYGFQSVIR